MTQFTRIIGISALFSLLLVGGCGVVMAESEQIFDPVFINYGDNMVMLSIAKDVFKQEMEILVIFTDSTMFTSEAVFKVFFVVAVDSYDPDGSDLTVNKVRGFGTVDGKGYFGEWTPKGGYNYYWLT